MLGLPQNHNDMVYYLYRVHYFMHLSQGLYKIKIFISPVIRCKVVYQTFNA